MTSVTVTGGAAAHRGSAAGSVLLPTSAEAVDAAFTVALTLVALTGFRAVFGGTTYLAVGAAALVLGLVLAFVTTRTKQPLLVVATVTVVTGVLLAGGVALRDTAAGGVLPTLSTLRELGGAVIHGWRQVLTTIRPVGDSGSLLALPYVLGLLSGVAGYSLARRVRPVLAPVLPPAGVAALSILFGALHPAAAMVQGAGFCAVAIGWLSVRSHREHVSLVRASRRSTRIAAGVAVLAAAAAVAGVAGPHVPFAHSSRVVLHATPPFDAGIYPSPLAAFRHYTPAGRPSVSDQALLSVRGLPAGTPVRIATLDAYDGLAWGASNAAGPGATIDGFARVGTMLPTTAAGAVHRVDITVAAAYYDVWLPDAGEVARLTFTGASAKELSGNVRFNLATQTGIVPVHLRPGDRYRIDVRIPGPMSDAALAQASPAGAPTLSSSAYEFVRPVAVAWAGGAGTPMAQVLAIADHLRAFGRYSNGDDASGTDPGHGQARIQSFLQAPQVVGDDEQYAAAMALLANAAGVPARVVIGAVPVDGLVKGSNVSAWVELDLAGSGWTTLPTDRFTPPRDRKPDPQPRKVPPQAKPQIVPPAIKPPPPSSETASAADTSARQAAAKRAAHRGFHVPAAVVTGVEVIAFPTLLALLVAGPILVMKSRRRLRRRTTGPPARRIAAGWDEVLDLARDLGTDVPKSATRRETATTVNVLPLRDIADVVDRGTFGPDLPSDTEATELWQRVDALRNDVLNGLDRPRRVRVLLSLRSLPGSWQPPRMPRLSLRAPREAHRQRPAVEGVS